MTPENRRRRLRKRALLALAMMLAACGEKASRTRTDAPAAARAPAPTVDADDGVLRIAEDSVAIGTRPGTANRDAITHADLVSVRVPAFAIDLRPYPNRAGTPPKTGVSRDEAARLCAAADKRLCHEIEWERACRTGATALRTIGSPTAEWTAGPATRFADTGHGVVRGGPTATGPERCGQRQALPTSTATADVGFRCCEGNATALAYPTEETHQTFVDGPMSTDTARAALASVPELAAYAATFSTFTESDVGQVFVRGGVTPEAVGVRRIVRGALRFTPRPYDEALVLAGRSGQTSLVAVLYPIGGGYVHGASMVLEDDPVSVLVTYAASNTTAAAWTSCFDCPGEGGQIELRPDGRILVVQR